MWHSSSEECKSRGSGFSWISCETASFHEEITKIPGVIFSINGQANKFSTLRGQKFTEIWPIRVILVQVDIDSSWTISTLYQPSNIWLGYEAAEQCLGRVLTNEVWSGPHQGLASHSTAGRLGRWQLMARALLWGKRRAESQEHGVGQSWEAGLEWELSPSAWLGSPLGGLAGLWGGRDASSCFMTCRSWVPMCQPEAVQVKVLVSEQWHHWGSGVPNPWDLMSDGRGSTDAIKCTINMMHVNHSKTTPTTHTPQVCEKLSFTKPVPGATGWGLLLYSPNKTCWFSPLVMSKADGTGEVPS